MSYSRVSGWKTQELPVFWSLCTTIVQLYREERNKALEHNKLLKAENEQLKAENKQLKLELGRQLHQSEDTDMETTGMSTLYQYRPSIN